MQVDETLSVVVTGGASGLGAATLSLLQAKDCTVACLDLPNEAVESDYAERGIHYMACDITQSDTVDQALEAVYDVMGVPQVLVNCAGIAPASRTVSRQGPHDPALFNQVLAVNLAGTFLVASRVAACMVDNEPGEDDERGVIINTASVAAYDGQVGQAAYAASKAGIAGLTLPMARDLASLGIRVCAIAPGIFETPMLTAMSEEVQQSLASQVPFPKRLGAASEYAILVQHIIENRMLNGEVIRLDGAIRMGAR